MCEYCEFVETDDSILEGKGDLADNSNASRMFATISREYTMRINKMLADVPPGDPRYGDAAFYLSIYLQEEYVENLGVKDLKIPIVFEEHLWSENISYCPMCGRKL